MKREAWSFQCAFIISVLSGVWVLCYSFSLMRTDALLVDGFTINGNAAKDMWDYLGTRHTPHWCSFTDCVEYVALTKSCT